MKFSEKWLREWVNPNISSEVLSEQLTMSGLEVDAAEPAAPEFDGIVVGKVLTAVPHPDADRLKVCEVDVGEGQPLQIVCGASNVRPELMVAAARIGAWLPGDFKIKRAKLRGVESEGMLCSAKELGLAESADGLMELSSEAVIGQSVREHLDLDDTVFELGLTPNRSDCLGVMGVAREVGVLNRVDVTIPEQHAVAATTEQRFEINVEAPEACPRYLGRVVTGINLAAETPVWMVERLRRSGVRAISAMVDITNYVMLELGQPMHAFDLQKLEGGIKVRLADAGEKLVLLDGQEIELNAETLLISDHKGPLALAGIMGGEASGVSDGTTSLLLEAAFFTPEVIAGRARGYGLHTDSSHRFERGVDPELQRRAMERATELLLEIAGGEAGPVIEVVNSDQLPQRHEVVLREARVARLLGSNIPAVEIGEILECLGMAVSRTDDGWKVIPPSFRFDIEIEADLVEEVARVHGYNALTSSRLLAEMSGQHESEQKLDARRLSNLLIDRGYQEAISYSFVDPELQSLLDPEAKPVELANALSLELSVMRTTLWPGLIKALQYNQNRQQSRIKLFETGLSFVGQLDDLVQKKQIAGVVSGSRYPEGWNSASDAVDFYDVKADIESLLALSGTDTAFRFESASHPALHPGQSAEIRKGDQLAGWLGAIHPSLLKKLGLNGPVFLFQLEVESITEATLPKFTPLSKFPAIRRDLAIVVDEKITAQQVVDTIGAEENELLQKVELFDVYSGEGVENGRKSLAIGLILQDHSRTLTDADVDDVISRVLNKIQETLGATLRD
ncbi:phenylalanine--tRNA ligase subunit beta [Solemya pervernicosa gill symbiont]|uniref:Phenylalanine--tRNA ligase beta subunit n=2 Tax=Gammaproteobacteria incertae sedis TaxID=118884 RepID=A0A1T2L9D0_9GAMM|nr:phenylalanine--tRNA ligase subunit beta [Candidatus Reidiella endopervernicosa]OOZ41680.1 phenylalanine--tRNA ligase subunit beta [Solemya pervernicosa gill symbiont]QKQ26669.1 phenylalanine--tRNA ligase subunit beta [Candidatus Reidiella endopervernicosa]